MHGYFHVDITFLAFNLPICGCFYTLLSLYADENLHIHE